MVCLPLDLQEPRYGGLNFFFLQNACILLQAFSAPRGSAPMAWYYDSQLRSSLRSLLARRILGTPKDNRVDVSIDIFHVASLEYHLI